MVTLRTRPKPYLSLQEEAPGFQTNKRRHLARDEWMDGRMDGWMDGWMDG